MAALVVRSIGPGASLQDAGRIGWQRYGVGPAGAMDRWSLALANVLVGNGPGAAAIELPLAGARLEVGDAIVRVAIAGADCALKIDGREVPPFTATSVHAGGVIEVGAPRGGVFSYLAIAGGMGLPPALGSLSLHARMAIGGIEGRTLRVGDRIPLQLSEPVGPDMAFSRPLPPIEDGPIRVVLGPQDDYFTPAGLATFLSEPYRITPQADRMGFRLTGPKIEHGPRGFNIVSDGIPTGAIQVPGSGEPIILLADRQTTGGYPKIATVVTADLPRLVQQRPGSELRFAAITRIAAQALLRAQLQELDRLRASLRPAGFVDLDSARLLSLNLIDGWTAGD